MMSRIGAIGGRLYRGEVSVEFVGRRRLWYSMSAAILLISLVSLLVRGLNFSVEFQGGAVFTVNGASTAAATQLEKAVSDAGVSGAIVQHVGTGSKASWQVQTKQLSPTQSQTVQNSLHSELGVSDGNISVTSVSGTWGSQITTKAVQALIAFLIVIVIYLSVAFEWKMAVAAFVALLHDLLITTGVYSLTGFQVSPASVIGFLTILGYSLYDTVVVFDKVRENTAGLLGGARSTYSQAANLALNQTLVRSINTSLIALLPVAAILFVGGGLLGAGELKDLALVLFVGMLSGTYSSIFIATPVLAQIKEREPQYRALAKRVALRAAGGRSAVKKAARTAGSGASRTSAAAGRRNGATSILEDDDLAAVDTDAGVDDVAYDTPEDDEAVTDVPASAAPGSRAQSAAGRAYTPGPRQQPRRDGRGGSARRRPAGKKKRR
ncbi:MAG: protein translocase subunit SecF [Streptosporangiaceae bacterium]|nr:protein translocase subunit SecF [Streptosporangiaceae bacterium]